MSATLLEISEVKLTKISKEYYALLCQENPLHYQKTELLEGVIFDKITKSNDHDFYSQVFFEAIQRILPEDFIIRVEKGRAYAKGLVDEYWIVDVSGKCVEVYNQPYENSYSQKRIFSSKEEIPLFGKFISLKNIFSE